MRILAAVVFFLFNISVMAAMPNPLPWNTDYISWSDPIGCEGSTDPIANCPVTGFLIQVAPTVNAPDTNWTTVAEPSADANEFIRPNLQPGINCYRIWAKPIGSVSKPSAVDCETTVKPVQYPQPPTLKSIDTVAYQENNGTNNKRTYSVVGTVPLGTICLPYTSNGYAMVPREKLTLAPGKTERPRQVWVKCG